MLTDLSATDSFKSAASVSMSVQVLGMGTYMLKNKYNEDDSDNRNI